MRITVATLRKNGETYVLQIDAETNEVWGCLTTSDGVEKEFKKGKKSAPFGAADLAKKVYSKQLQDGWELEGSPGFAAFTQALLKGSTPSTPSSSKVKKVAKPKPKPKPKKPSLKELFKMPAARLIKEATQDLSEARGAIAKLKTEKAVN